MSPEARASAVELFDAGDRLKAEGHLSQACPKYQESYRLDPQLGALLHLADCLEHEGKLASAYASFRAAAELAELKSDARKALAEERSRALAPKLSRLTVDVPEAVRVPGLEVRRDGQVLAAGTWGTPIALDAGEHRVRVTAPGRAPWERSITMQNGAASVRVEVPLLKVPGATPAPAEASVATPASATTTDGKPADEPAKGRSRLIVASYVVGGAGVVGVVVGGVFLARRSSELDASKSICPTGVCPEGMGAASQIRIDDHLKRARSAQTIAIVSLGAGGALLATGAVLLVVGSQQRQTERARFEFVPAFDSQQGALLARGVF